MRAAALLAASLALAPAPRAAAADAPDVVRLFPFAAEVHVSAAGLARLEIPDEVLAASRGELADVRLFDRAGREIPYLVDPGADVDLALRWSAPAEVVTVDRERQIREGRAAERVEEYELAWPPTAPPEGAVELVVDTAIPAFVRRVSVVGRRSGALTLLVDDRSLSRLPSSATDLVRIPLPRFDGESIVVTIRGEEDFYLEPTFRFETAAVRRADEPVALPLRVDAQRREDDRTVLEVKRPAAVAPSALRIASTSPWFDRRVEVFDVGPGGGDVRVGEGRLVRAGAADTERTEVPLEETRGSALRIVIHDAGSPPLEGLEVAALVRRPALLFSVADRTEPAATLYFGGGRAVAPSYDLAALLPDADAALSGERAEIAARLRDRTGLATARLGPIRANPAYDDEPVLAFAMRPGAAIDARSFAHRRHLVVPASRDGLAHLVLAPEDLARARPDLADLRVVDAGSHQRAYLLDRAGTPAWIDLEGERSPADGKRSLHRLAVPRGPLTIAALRLVPRPGFVDRAYELAAVTPTGREIVSSGRLRAGRGASEISLTFRPVHTEAFELVVDDGDDAPLELRARARVDLPRLYLAAPAGEYALLLGDDSAEPPSYDLERARDLVRSLDSVPVAAGPLEENPEFRPLARWWSAGARGTLVQEALLWGAILAAVAGLVALTLRLARSRPDAS